MNSRWTRSASTVFNIGYHLIWSSKYRRKVLIGEIASRLEELLQLKAQELKFKLQVVAIQPDHIHIFVKSDPTDSPHYIVQQLKGYTSRILRQEFLSLRTKLPSLWTRNYYCESVGHISQKVIAKYIEDQKYQ